MEASLVPFADLLSVVIDNRGRTCPVAESGIPLIATNCLRNDFLYPSYDKVRYVSQETYDNWFRGHPRPGDLIFVTKGTPGRVCIAPDPVDFCIAQDMVAVRADQSKIYSKYLFALLRSAAVQNQIEQMHVGTLIPHFKKGDFDKLLLPVPDPGAQRVIGDLYFDFSAKIELNRRMNETLEATARAIFKSWFVDFDTVRAKAENRQPCSVDTATAVLFPSSFEDSPLGKIPKGWAVGAATDFARLNPEAWSKQTAPAQIEYVDLSNTKWGRIDSTANHLWKDAPSRAQRVLRPGDTIIGTVRPGNGAYALVDRDGLTGSTGFAALRPLKPEFREFVYLALTAKDNIERLARLADGAAYPAVRPEVVAATIMIAPQQDVIREFARGVKALLDRIASSDSESRTLATIRDTLLPKLVSGEIRIKNAENMVGARP